jgi:hypothetical protein
LNRPAGPDEELNIQVKFQQLDLPTQWWLRHVQPFLRAAEMQFGGHGDERTELPQLEHRCSFCIVEIQNQD